jgi:PKD repeat protein
MCRVLAILALNLVLLASSFAGTKITPTTTLTAESGNNTSTADTFRAQSNGNIGAGNISKLPTRSLLYPGASTSIYVHWMPWFGPSNHMNVGYDSSDPAQVARQVADMYSRGIDGAIVDWYGPESTHHNNATVALRDASAANGSFQFAITEDVGALNKCASTVGCDVTQKLISDLTYAWKTFEQSSAYLRYNGRPVVFFFGVEKYAIDWNRAKANVPGQPLFINRNAGGFTKTASDGSFAWVTIDTTNRNNIGLSYLDNFYSTALKYPAELPFASAWKGFDDTLAAWSANRIMNQNCGQTWLSTWAELAKYYSANNQLYAMQIATWNDYEEGSEIETGVDNCVSVSAAVNGTTLSWSINGQENTLDHYTVSASLDGQNLMPLADLAIGVNALDLSAFALEPAQYTIYVKAIGRPSMSNKMSQPVSYFVANKPPVAALAVTPVSAIAPANVSATTDGSWDPDGTIASVSIEFGDGTVVAAPNATHSYNSPGNYTITATVTDNLGATAMQAAVVTILANQLPRAVLAVTPASGIAPVTVAASTVGSSDADGVIASTVINWGDGTSTSSANGSHPYGKPGAYTITATVTDDRGAQSSATSAVTVRANQAPVAKLSLSSSTGIAPSNVTASTAGSTDLDGSIVSTVINWGDGSSISASSGSHIYNKAGTYKVVATLKDDRGAISTASATVTIAWGVKVNLPATSTSKSPVHVVASATSGVPVIAMKIYVDYVAVYSTSTAKLDTWLKLSRGARRVVVQAWDANGVVYKTTSFVTVN